MHDPLTEQTGLTPEQRRLRAQVAAHALWGRTTDPAAHTAPGRAAFLDRFEKQADPDGTLAPEVRARLATHLRKQHFKTLALKSSRARAAKAARRDGESPAPQSQDGGAVA
jgi:hypothetical protein